MALVDILEIYGLIKILEEGYFLVFAFLSASAFSSASDSGDDLDGTVTSGAEQFIQIYGSFYFHTFQYCDTFVKSLETKIKRFADIRKNNSRFRKKNQSRKWGYIGAIFPEGHRLNVHFCPKRFGIGYFPGTTVTR